VGKNASSRVQGRASREAFIAATGRLLRRQGYAATGLNEIVARSGAPKGSLYFHFPGGKEQLALAAMEQTGEQLRAAIAAIMGSCETTMDGLSVLIDALGSGLEASWAQTVSSSCHRAASQSNGPDSVVPASPLAMKIQSSIGVR